MLLPKMYNQMFAFRKYLFLAFTPLLFWNQVIKHFPRELRTVCIGWSFICIFYSFTLTFCTLKGLIFLLPLSLIFFLGGGEKLSFSSIGTLLDRRCYWQCGDKTAESSTFDETNIFLTARCQCYKTFLYHHWQCGLISKRVCPWEPFPVRS